MPKNQPKPSILPKKAKTTYEIEGQDVEDLIWEVYNSNWRQVTLIADRIREQVVEKYPDVERLGT